MDNIIKFLKAFAGESVKKLAVKGLGAIPNPKDPRDIPVKAFQPQTKKLPTKHITDISHLAVLDQKANGSCVGHAVGLAVAFYDHRETGKLSNPSPRFIYGLAKRIDAYTGEGTQPRLAGLVTQTYGCATEKTLRNDSTLSHSKYITFDFTSEMLKDAKPRKIGGYAFVGATLNELKNAIINNGVVLASLPVGNWNSLPVKSGSNGYHYIVIYGYDGEKIYFRNSWGSNWGNGGNGYFNWKDFNGKILDIMVITDIPNEVLEEAKEEWKYKYFKPTERTGSYGTVVDLKPELLDMLEKAREYAGIPFKLNSGFRTVAQNKLVGGETNSAHLRGLAVDIQSITSSQKFKIVQAGLKAGFRRIGVGKTFIHLDCDTSLDKDVMWDYK